VLLILDTDHLSIVQERSQPAYDRLRARLAGQPTATVATTIVCFQERIQGWFAYLNRKGQTPARIVRGYRELEKVLLAFCQANVLSFDDAAQSRFADLARQRLRVPTMDLRIASIALVNGARLLSCNLRDFRRVPGLAVEDWTV
jgi:tRNA(fMet)-specific endonuclease VapC